MVEMIKIPVPKGEKILERKHRKKERKNFAAVKSI